MNELQVFNNPEFGSVRTVVVDGDPWFVGKDVASALGYGEGKSPVNAVANHVDDEDKGVTEMMTPKGSQKTIIINESGLYSLILSSKLPSAKKFKRWVTSEVLPAIRKIGKYQTAEVEKRELTSDDYIKAAQIIASCRNERLPYVVGFLRQSGFTIPAISITSVTRDVDGETARYIHLAKDHGLSGGQISRLTGLHRNQINRIALGQSNPKRDRADLIIHVIKEALPEIE